VVLLFPFFLADIQCHGEDGHRRRTGGMGAGCEKAKASRLFGWAAMGRPERHSLIEHRATGMGPAGCPLGQRTVVIGRREFEPRAKRNAPKQAACSFTDPRPHLLIPSQDRGSAELQNSVSAAVARRCHRRTMAIRRGTVLPNQPAGKGAGPSAAVRHRAHRRTRGEGGVT
jgi:hypothetical protein